MKRWIRKWLGIDEVLDQLAAIRYENRGQHQDITAHLNRIAGIYGAQANGLARIIAKLDPMYGKNEFDANRIAESKKLEDEILTKLYAEYQATNRGQ